MLGTDQVSNSFNDFISTPPPSTRYQRGLILDCETCRSGPFGRDRRDQGMESSFAVFGPVPETDLNLVGFHDAVYPILPGTHRNIHTTLSA